jgi:hypothetical protein
MCISCMESVNATAGSTLSALSQLCFSTTFSTPATTASLPPAVPSQTSAAAILTTSQATLTSNGSQISTTPYPSSCISACLTFDEADDPSCTDLNCMCHYILQGGPICSSCILEKENLTKAILAGELISTCLSLSLLNMESTIGANTATTTASVALSIAGVSSTSSSRSSAGSGGLVIDVMIVYAIEIIAVVAGLLAVFI